MRPLRRSSYPSNAPFPADVMNLMAMRAPSLLIAPAFRIPKVVQDRHRERRETSQCRRSLRPHAYASRIHPACESHRCHSSLVAPGLADFTTLQNQPSKHCHLHGQNLTSSEPMMVNDTVNGCLAMFREAHAKMLFIMLMDWRTCGRVV